MPKRTPGTDNRVLRVCRLLNRHRVRYLIAIARELDADDIARKRSKNT